MEITIEQINNYLAIIPTVAGYLLGVQSLFLFFMSKESAEKYAPIFKVLEFLKDTKAGFSLKRDDK